MDTQKILKVGIFLFTLISLQTIFVLEQIQLLLLYAPLFIVYTCLSFAGRNPHSVIGIWLNSFENKKKLLLALGLLSGLISGLYGYFTLHIMWVKCITAFASVILINELGREFIELDNFSFINLILLFQGIYLIFDNKISNILVYILVLTLLIFITFNQKTKSITGLDLSKDIIDNEVALELSTNPQGTMPPIMASIFLLFINKYLTNSLNTVVALLICLLIEMLVSLITATTISNLQGILDNLQVRNVALIKNDALLNNKQTNSYLNKQISWLAIKYSINYVIELIILYFLIKNTSITIAINLFLADQFIGTTIKPTMNYVRS